MVTENTIHTDPTRRHDFLLLFDVADGNPNGDPDAGNLPRTDPQTGHGLVTDVCLKRKIRNFIQIAAVNDDDTPRKGCDIYVQEKAVLSTVRAYEALGGKATFAEAREKMCEFFYDVRMFGAVMSLKENNAGQVRGPVQFTFARSVSPVTPVDVSITRMAVETEKEAKEQQGDNRTMGRKALLPYGLYVGYGFFSAPLARKTGASADDLALLWQAIAAMFDHDHSAARGRMACRGLYVFTHDDALGQAPSHRLFEKIHVSQKDPSMPPRSFADYSVTIDESETPGVQLTRLVDG